MRQKEDLFHLIKSMTRTEKRYFTTESSKGDQENRYLELFQFINQMEEFDEEKLKEAFPQNLSADKKYLYESVLKRLRDYKRNKSWYIRIRELIIDARYLYKRGLHIQAEARLSEAKSLAEETGDQLALLEIIELETYIRWHTDSDFIKKIKSLFDQRKKIQECFHTENQFTELTHLLSIALKNGMGKKELHELAPILDELDAIYQDEEPPEDLTMLAKRRFFQNKAIYAQINKNLEKAAKYYSQVVPWWENHEKYKSEEFSRYVVDISNLINAYFSVEAFDQVWEQIQLMEKEAAKNKDIEVQGLVFLKSSIFKILYFINTGARMDLQKLGGHIRSGLKKYQLNEGSRVVLIGNMAIYCFCCEDFEKCIEWCEQITKKRRKTATKERDQVALLLLWLLSKYELGQVEALDNAVRATQRSLKAKNALQEGSFSFTFFHFIKELIPLYGKEEKDHFKKIRDSFKEMMTKNRTNIPFDLHELGMYWAESRLTELPILELIKKNKDGLV